MVVEPPDPLESGELDVLDVAPRTSFPDDLGLEEADDGLGQGVIVAVSDAADRRFDAGLSQSLHRE